MTENLTNPFQPAAREQVRIRAALYGPSGSGKSYTALMLATNLAERVAAIDTEHGRLLEHASRFTFDHLAPTRFDPRELVKFLAQAGANGYGAIVIDSLSHYWMGAGGALEFVDSRETARGGKFSAGWNEFRPIERRMLDALLAYPGHVIATMRVKTAYVVETNERGKAEPKKVGLKPEQREGIEYEFSVVADMDRDHTMTVTKTTCEDLIDARINRPGPEVAATLAAWAGTGKPAADAISLRDRAIEDAATVADLRALYAEAKHRGLLGAAVIDEFGDDATLGELIERRGKEAQVSEQEAGRAGAGGV